MGAGIPSIALGAARWLAAAIAARTTRLRIGTGVSVPPALSPHSRTAEEAATVDQISQGRLDFGVGRSGFPAPTQVTAFATTRAASASRNRSIVILKAWTRRTASRTAGNTSRSTNLTGGAAALSEAAPTADLGRGHHARHVPDGRAHGVLARHRAARGFRRPRGDRPPRRVSRARARGRACEAYGNVYLRIPVYVAATAARPARSPRRAHMRAYRRLAENMRSVGRRDGNDRVRKSAPNAPSASRT